MATPQAPHSAASSKKGLHRYPLLLSPPPAHLPPTGGTERGLPPLSLLLSQPRRPDAALDVGAPDLGSPSSTPLSRSLSLSPLDSDQHEQGSADASFRACFCGGCNPALSSAAILVGAVLFLTLVPSWIGFWVLKSVAAAGSNQDSLPPFWYLTLIGAFTSLTIGVVSGCIVGVRASRSQEMTSGLMFLTEDWVGRVAVAGCLVLGIFALPIGMAILSRASAYRAVDGSLMEVVGLGIFFVLGVGGAAGYVLWHSVRGEWRRRKGVLIGYKY